MNTDEEYQNALEHSFHYEDEIVVEPYIKGREFACGIIDGKGSPSDRDHSKDRVL